jgi:hypothetical protein
MNDAPDTTEIRPCRYCVAAYDFTTEECGWAHAHNTPELHALAVALTRMFGSDNQQDDETVGWFMEDAQAIYEDFKRIPKTWAVERLECDDQHFVAKFNVNRAVYIIEDGEGHCTPVRLSEWRRWQREAGND